MSSYKTEVQNLRYNAATQSFEALVVMYEGLEAIKYPCSMRLPITSDFSFVSHRLVAQAKAQRSRKARQLISHAPSGRAKLVHLGDLAKQLKSSFHYDTPKHAA